MRLSEAKDILNAWHESLGRIKDVAHQLESRARAAEIERDALKVEVERLKIALTNARSEVVAFNTVLADLRKHEGSTVSIHSDNGDFNGQPNCAVDVTDEWTGWEPRRFTGDTVFLALRAALRARNIQETV